MTTVSAEAKLMPRPPARVDNRKQKSYRGKKKKDRQTDKKTKTDVHVQSENTTQHLHILCKRAENLPQTLLH